MSDLIKKVSTLMTAHCGYCGGSGEDQYHDPEIPCGHCNGDGFHSTPGTARDVVKTVLEEMHKFSLSYEDKTENSQHFKGTRAIHRETFLEKFAKHNNIPIGGENE